MKKSDWTLQALAAATGVDPGNLYRILNGQQEPRVSTAIAIAQCLKIGVEELFSRGSGAN